VLPLIFYATQVFRIKVRDSYRRIRIAIARINSHLQETRQRHDVLQLFNREHRAYDKFSDVNDVHREAYKDAILAHAVYYPVVEILSSVAIATVIWFGGNRTCAGHDCSRFGCLRTKSPSRSPRTRGFRPPVVNGVRQDGIFVGFSMHVVDVRELVVSAVFPVEELQHGHAADVFLQMRVDARDGDADPAVRVTYFDAEDLRGIEDQRKHRKSDESQLPVHHRHDGDDSGQHEDVLEN